ncbi:MAG: hypothetical protein PPP56_03765 [Longimonas sp.]|uniref:hypothetical protein n=1 Tax=Longimonas sp. TaxID=2039626 RepID=UPI00335CEE20
MAANADSSEQNDAWPADSAAMLNELSDAVRPSVEMLVAQIDAATEHIAALESENEELRTRVQALEDKIAEQPDVPANSLVFALEDADADALKQELERYIQTIDTLLDDLPPPPDSDVGDTSLA